MSSDKWDILVCIGYIAAIVLAIGVSCCYFYVGFFKSENISVIAGVVERVEVSGYNELFDGYVASVRVGGKDYKAVYDVSGEELLGLLGKSVVLEYGYVRKPQLNGDLEGRLERFPVNVDTYFASIREVV